MSYSHFYRDSSMLHASMSGCMGTQFDMLLVGDDSAKLQRIWSEVESSVVSLQKRLSRFERGGELYNLNCNAAMGFVAVSDQLWEVLSECYGYNQLTGGYFDITLGEHHNWVLDSASQSIYFISESMSLDLGAYGKGCAIDMIRSRLSTEGITSAFVNFGNSSILAMGRHPCGDCWPISVVNPYTKEVLVEYELRDTTLTVSGNTPSHEGHIVDPRTGEYDMRRRVVAVECHDPKLGEVLTTSMMLMGDDESQSLYERVGERVVSRYVENL